MRRFTEVKKSCGEDDYAKLGQYCPFGVKQGEKYAAMWLAQSPSLPSAFAFLQVFLSRLKAGMLSAKKPAVDDGAVTVYGDTGSSLKTSCFIPVLQSRRGIQSAFVAPDMP